MGNIDKIKSLRTWVSVGLIYTILIIFADFRDMATYSQLIFLLIQGSIAFVTGRLTYEITKNKDRSILIGILSFFTFFNIFIIIYVLKQTNIYINEDILYGNNEEEDFIIQEEPIYNENLKMEENTLGESEINKEKIRLKNLENNYFQLYKKQKKISKRSIIFNIIGTIIIGFLSFYIYTNYMDIRSLESKLKKQESIYNNLQIIQSDKVVEETIKESEEIEGNNNKDIVDNEKSDFEKLIVSGHAMDKSNPYMRTITGTITNNSNMDQNYDVRVVFYDKSNNPIATESYKYQSIESGGINGFKVNLYDNVNNINRYEVQLVNTN